MTDQQRFDALGVRNPHIKTPNLDRLAKNGVLYSQAVCQCPMCVPSRNSMMMGYYPSQLGVRSNAGGLFFEDKLVSRPLPEILHRNGYQTAGFGKTHWNHGLFNHNASTRGFEIRAEGQPRSGPLYEKGAVMMDDVNFKGLGAYYEETKGYGGGEENPNGYIGCTSRLAMRDHRDGFIAEQCMKFLDEGVDPERPLFLYLSFIKPHAGFNVPKQFEDLYDIDDIPDIPQPAWESEPDTHLEAEYRHCGAMRRRYEAWRTVWKRLTPMQRRRTTLRYYANCSWLDSYFGMALEKLEKAGRLDNCLIVYTSDHGEMLGERQYLFSKYCLFDSSVRVPLILSGTAVPQDRRGTVDDRPAELVDLLPTLQTIAGDVPDKRLPGFDLFSERRRVGAFSEFHGGGSEVPPPAPAYMWRKKDWKLILYLGGALDDAIERCGGVKGELYHLDGDPHEWNNLFYEDTYSGVRERMTRELLMHLACCWAKGPFYYDKKDYQ